MPENTVYVGRPTFWGNPNEVVNGNYALAVALYRTLFSPFQNNPGVIDMCLYMRSRAVRDLRGKNLACWCPLDKPCHADVLLEIANGRD